MADLLFTAGLDTRPVRKALKGLRDDAKHAGSMFRSVAKTGLGVFGAATAVGAIKKGWREAAGAVEEYKNQNMFAARELAGIEKELGKVQTAFGRFFTALAIEGKGTIAEVTGFMTGAIEAWQFALLGEASFRRMQAQEAITKQANRNALMRDMGGGLDEDIMRLQGRHGAADRLRAENRYLEYQHRLDGMESRGEITRSDRLLIEGKAGRRKQLEVAEAMKRDVRSFSGAVPRALRGHISGVMPGQASRAEQKAERDAKKAQAQRDKSNKHLATIAKNTGKKTVGTYGP